jgi:hypothetical protein
LFRFDQFQLINQEAPLLEEDRFHPCQQINLHSSKKKTRLLIVMVVVAEMVYPGLSFDYCIRYWLIK